MIDISRFGYADDWVNQETAANLLRRPLGELFVSAVQWVTGLEGDNAAPAERFKVLAQLGGRAPQVDEIVVRRHADHFERAGSIMPGRPLQIRHGGMGRVKRCHMRAALHYPCRISINLFDMQKSQQVTVNVAQRQRLCLPRRRRPA